MLPETSTPRSSLKRIAALLAATRIEASGTSQKAPSGGHAAGVTILWVALLLLLATPILPLRAAEPHAPAQVRLPSPTPPAGAAAATRIPSTEIPSTEIPSTEIPSTAIPGADTFTATVLVERLRLRAGPDEDQPLLARAGAGEVLELLGQSDDCAWLLVRSPAGQRGWIVGDPLLIQRTVACEQLPLTQELVATPTVSPTATVQAAPTATHTATPTRTPTPLAAPAIGLQPALSPYTPTPAPTATPTLAATDTPTTAPTVTRTATPTRTSTPLVAPAIGLRPALSPYTPTPRPTATRPRPAATATTTPPQPTADPLLAIAAAGPRAVSNLLPESGTETRQRLPFSWEADAPLAEGQLFEVAFWQKGQPQEEAQGWTGATINSTLSANTYDQPSGEYLWGVWLGATVDGVYYRLRYLGGGNTLRVLSEPTATPNAPAPTDCPPTAPCK